MEIKTICVFCGSAVGARPVYARAAVELAVELAARGLGLVTGGGRVGLMGALADAALERGVRVTGVIPGHLLDLEVGHAGLSEMRVVNTMLERKSLMAELSDAFLTLPGGLGTLDELFEMLTWTQLGLHAKPCGLFNVDGYFDPLLAFLEQASREGFVQGSHRSLLVSEPTPAGLLQAMADWRPVRADKAAWALSQKKIEWRHP